MSKALVKKAYFPLLVFLSNLFREPHSKGNKAVLSFRHRKSLMPSLEPKKKKSPWPCQMGAASRQNLRHVMSVMRVKRRAYSISHTLGPI